MRWLKPRRGGHPSDADSEETRADSVQTASAEEIKVTEAPTEFAESDRDDQPAATRRRIHWSRAIAFRLIPGLALLLASAAGFLKFQDISAQEAALARAESVRTATDSTIALLSYKPDTVRKDLETARNRLTGSFLDSYTELTHDVVIPGAQQKQVSAVANVPGAALVRATGSHAVVLLFVNQTITVGNDAPTNTASSVRVTLDKINSRWLISQFDPV
jgi:Mce-associated membrane protein